MPAIDTVVDEALKALGKLDDKLKEAEGKAKDDSTKEKIKELRKKVSDATDELKAWKKNPGATKALDILTKLLEKLARELPPVVEELVKAYLEALGDSIKTAYGLAYKSFKRFLQEAEDPEHPTKEEIDTAAKNATNDKEDQEWIKFLWEVEQAKKRVVDEKKKKAEE